MLVALLMVGQVGHAAEAARMKNYDQWKDLPSKTLFDMGNGYMQVDKIDSALVCATILLNRYNDKMTIKEKGICIGAIVGAGDIYMHRYYDYQTAYRYLLKAEMIAQENHFEQQLANIYVSEAILQADRLDLENNYSYQSKVLELFRRAFYQAISSHHSSAICYSFGNMAYYSMKHNHVGDIINEINTFSIFEVSDSISHSGYFKKICEILLAYESGKYEEALGNISQIEKLLPQNESPQNIARDRSITCVFKCVLLFSLNRDEEALQELDKAENIARDNNLQDAVVEYLKLKQDYFETHGNAVMAKEYKLKYFEAKDEFVNRSKLLSVEQQKFLIELEEMGEEVKDLETQKRMRELVIAGIAVLALLVIAALIYLWFNYRNTKRRNLVLFQKNQELLALEQERNTPAEKYKSSPMDEQAKDELLQRIHHVMENHDEIYDEGFTLDQLAGLIDANPNYVSQVINEKKGCNFKAFVNDYKIKEACRRLSDPDKYSTYTIEAIGQSVGFGSRTHFYAIFKKFTGMTPAAYQRIAQDKPSDSQ